MRRVTIQGNYITLRQRDEVKRAGRGQVEVVVVATIDIRV
jgi:hypothetical protein